MFVFHYVTFPCSSLHVQTQGKPENEAMYIAYIYTLHKIVLLSPLPPSHLSPSLSPHSVVVLLLKRGAKAGAVDNDGKVS